jgi:hypothetical protein
MNHPPHGTRQTGLSPSRLPLSGPPQRTPRPPSAAAPAPAAAASPDRRAVSKNQLQLGEEGALASPRSHRG